MNDSEIYVDYCSYEAADYAVKHWHYSGSMPPPPRVMIGIWELEKFAGVVIFSRGANKNLLKPYGLNLTQGCELTRIALGDHISCVSRCVKYAISLLKKSSPNLRLIVSFADPDRGHHGGVYQAGNWIYSGATQKSTKLRLPNGSLLHPRQFSTSGVKKQFGSMRVVPKPSDGTIIMMPGKHRYLYPLDRAMRRQIQSLSKPYPIKFSPSVNGDSDATSDAGRFNPDPKAFDTVTKQ